jgi:membrane-bound metal-dependent hydrolase YbcI (DUF457 family)
MVGRLLFSLLFENLDYDLLSFALIFAVLPDFDVILSPLKKILKWDYLEHRGGSHSFVIGVILALIGSTIFSLITQHSFLQAFFLGIIFNSLHIALDLLTTTEIPIFYPFSKRERGYYVEKAGSMFTMVISAVFFILLYIVNRFGDPNLLPPIRTIMAFLFLGYYLFRIFVKYFVTKKTPINQKYLPGIFPLNYFLFESNSADHNLHVYLEKKSLLNGTTLQISRNYELSATEKPIFNKAISLCNADYYRKKWTKFPKIVKEDGKFTVRFYFLETMMNNKTMNLEYEFEPNEGILLNENRSYGKID